MMSPIREPNEVDYDDESIEEDSTDNEEDFFTSKELGRGPVIALDDGKEIPDFEDGQVNFLNDGL